MKLALITDLHANREAVEAVLEHAHAMGATQHALLGDFVGYGADPAWVVDRVRELVAGGAWAVRGNHDQAAITAPSPHMIPIARQVVEWTRARLDASQLEFLVRLPMSCEQMGCLFVHANAWAPQHWGYIQGRADALRSLRATRAGYTVCGHVHEPRLYHRWLEDRCADFVPKPGIAIPVPPSRQWLVIPGAAGQPRDGEPAACYAMLDLDQKMLTFHRVPYDHESAAAKIAAAGLPQFLAQRLAEGQ